MAPVETDIDKSVHARRNLRIIFLYSEAGEFRARTARGVNRDRQLAGAANGNNEQTNSAGKCGQIYSGAFVNTAGLRTGATLSITI
jgi:hypothetical protein